MLQRFRQLIILSIAWFIQGQAAPEAAVLETQPSITALHSIYARQSGYEINQNGKLQAFCDVCEAPGVNVSVYWGRDDTQSGVPAFVIGGKIKYPNWISSVPEMVPDASCGPSDGSQVGIRYVVSLSAESLQVTDSGRWWCQLLPNEASPDWRFSYFSINVFGSLSPASDVTLKANDTELSDNAASISVIENSTTLMTCDVSPDKVNLQQNLTVSWKIEGSSEFLAHNQHTLEYVANVDHFGKTLVCLVDYLQADGQAPTIVKRIALNIILKPRVAISAWGPAGVSVSSANGGSISSIRSVLVDEGQHLELHCSAFSNLLHNTRGLTGKESYQWFTTDPHESEVKELVYAKGMKSLTLNQMGRHRDGSIVRCSVDNGVFMSSSNIQISVQYKLASDPEPTFVGAVIGDTVSLDCTEGDPDIDRFISNYKFTWFFGRMQIVFPDDGIIGKPQNILTFPVANSSQFGNYRCLAKNIRSNQQTVRNFFVVEHAKPQATSTLQIVDAVLHYSGTIRCSTFGLPRPRVFRWFRFNSSEPSNEIVVDENNEIEIIVKNASSAVTESFLTIKSVKTEDFGRYICIAENQFGQVESSFLLARREPFPTIEIIAGACAGVFVIIVLVGVVIFFKCRGRRDKRRNDSGANSLKLSETASSGSSSDNRRDSLTSPYTVQEKQSPVAVVGNGPPHHLSYGTLPVSVGMPSLMPSYHRYDDSTIPIPDPGLVRLSTSVTENFDDWLKQSRLATFSHMGAYQPSFRHPLPPVSSSAIAGQSSVSEQNRLATDV